VIVETDELMTVADVADYLRVPQRTVRTWWQRGIIRGGTKLPGTSVVRFYPAEVIAWAEEGRRETKKGSEA
jgi:excisionase family DNA binding protein